MKKKPDEKRAWWVAPVEIAVALVVAGWLALAFLLANSRPTEAAEPEAQPIQECQPYLWVRVKDDWEVRIRAGAGSSYATLRYVTVANDWFGVIGQEGDWYQLCDRTYITALDKYVEVSNRPPTPSPTRQGQVQLPTITTTPPPEIELTNGTFILSCPKACEIEFDVRGLP